MMALKAAEDPLPVMPGDKEKQATTRKPKPKAPRTTKAPAATTEEGLYEDVTILDAPPTSSTTEASTTTVAERTTQPSIASTTPEMREEQTTQPSIPSTTPEVREATTARGTVTSSRGESESTESTESTATPETPEVKIEPTTEQPSQHDNSPTALPQVTDQVTDHVKSQGKGSVSKGGTASETEEFNWFWVIFSILAVIAGVLIVVVIPALTILAAKTRISVSKSRP